MDGLSSIQFFWIFGIFFTLQSRHLLVLQHLTIFTFHCGSAKDAFVGATLKLSIRRKAAAAENYNLNITSPS